MGGSKKFEAVVQSWRESKRDSQNYQGHDEDRRSRSRNSTFLTSWLQNQSHKIVKAEISFNDSFDETWINTSAFPSRATLLGNERRQEETDVTTVIVGKSSIPSLNTSMTSKRREWRSAVEAKSGKTYYYDAITRETQWRKPLELATQSEREKIEEKDKKLRDFFRSMEMNILKAMDRGQVPGIATTCEDVVKPLRNSTSNTKMKLKKPSLIRTISSMDDTLIEELTQDIEIYNITSSGLISPDNTTTSFFDSLPQPSQKNPSTSQYSPPPFATSSDLDRAPTCFKSKITPPASEVSKHLPKPTMAKRNTCGSLYIRNTMADPDKDACIKVLCGVFRTHIVQSTKEYTAQPKFEDYEVFNDNHEEHPFTHDSHSVIVETTDAIETMRIEDKIPSLDEISSFYRFVFNKAQMEFDCIIMSLIYVERLLRETKGGVRPTVNNWRSVLFSCMILASKVWDDLSMWNADFSLACPTGVTFSLQRINQLELAVLNCLKYNVKVPASEYAKYYFLMRSMLIRSGLAGQDVLSATPLDLDGAKELEFISSNYGIERSSKSKLRRSKSLDVCVTDSGSNSPSRRCHVNLEQVVRM